MAERLNETKKDLQKRRMRSFEAEEDVDRMLERAKEEMKIPIAEICNRALKDHGEDVIQEIITERQINDHQWLKARQTVKTETRKPTARNSELLKKTFKSKG